MSLDVSIKAIREVEIFEANITHNLGKMASEVSNKFYLAVWHPERLGITTCSQLYNYLYDGLFELKSKPDYYRQFENPEWGRYEDFIPWLEKYLKVCQENPDGVISTSS